MRVLVAGRHELAALVLERVTGLYDVSFAIGSPERRGRGPGARETARMLGIPIFEDTGSPSLSAAVDAVHPDVLLSLGHPRIVSPSVLSRVDRTANVHFGALPRYRGSWSIPQAILAGETAIGVTLHAIASGIDDGPIIAQRFLPSDDASCCGSLYDAAVAIGADMAIAWLDALRNGVASLACPQDEAAATYFPPAYPGAFHIEWRQTSLQVSRYLRAGHFPPLPSAYSMIGDLRIEFDWPVDWLAGRTGSEPCGTIVMLDDGRIGITILNGIVLPQGVKINDTRARFDDLVRRESWLGRRLA